LLCGTGRESPVRLSRVAQAAIATIHLTTTGVVAQQVTLSPGLQKRTVAGINAGTITPGTLTITSTIHIVNITTTAEVVLNDDCPKQDGVPNE
jgi:hypothetical protein